MDINGVWASVNFPSFVTGFCGRVLRAVFLTRSWVLRSRGRGTTGSSRSGTPPHQDRIIPLGISFITDPEAGARGNPPQRRTRIQGQ